LVLECIVFLGIIVYLFIEKIQDEEILVPIYETTIFWISTAFVFYFAGNFFLFMYAKTSATDKAFPSNYTLIYSTVTITKSIFLCIGITIKERKFIKTEEEGEYEEEDNDTPLSKKNLDFLDFDNDSR
jgi:hypothetical protein